LNAWRVFEHLCARARVPGRPVDLETAADGSGNAVVNWRF